MNEVNWFLSAGKLLLPEQVDLTNVKRGSLRRVCIN